MQGVCTDCSLQREYYLEDEVRDLIHSRRGNRTWRSDDFDVVCCKCLGQHGTIKSEEDSIGRPQNIANWACYNNSWACEAGCVYRRKGIYHPASACLELEVWKRFYG